MTDAVVTDMEHEIKLNPNKVMVGMSGGVDSSVAALLLRDKGMEVVGATLRLYDHPTGTVQDEESCDGIRTCCSLADVEDARQVCYKLGLDHFVFNFTDDFSKKVIDYFIASYKAGETPNPCIACNREIKFAKLIDRADLLCCGKIATGHYARVEWDEQINRWILMKATDHKKDQTYMLATLTQNQLSRLIFPLGDYEKPQIRKLAEGYELSGAKKPDSQDICFVRGNDYAGFIEAHSDNATDEGSGKEGYFVDESGKRLGRHKGIIHYTIGQRKGLGLSFDSPRYVIDKNSQTNEVILGKEEALYKSCFIAREINYIAIPLLTSPIRVEVKTRYSQEAIPATISPLQDGSIQVSADTPIRAITKGQAVVFYQGERVIAGGVI